MTREYTEWPRQCQKASAGMHALQDQSAASISTALIWAVAPQLLNSPITGHRVTLTRSDLSSIGRQMIQFIVCEPQLRLR